MSGLGLPRQAQAAAGRRQARVRMGLVESLADLGFGQAAASRVTKSLDARDLETGGTKRAMVKRLQADLEGERLQATAYTEQLESEFHINKDIEERGSVYACGTNYAGPARPGRHGASQRLHGGPEDARHRRGRPRRVP